MNRYEFMYAEYCNDLGDDQTAAGFADFVAWRKRVEKFFENKYKPKEKEASQPISNKNNFEAYENMLQNKFKNN